MRCEEPVKIIEIMRLWEQGYSQREIASSVKCGKTTVGEIQRRCREQSLVYSEAEKMNDEEIRRRLYPALYEMQEKKDPDWDAAHKRLEANRRLNLRYLWEEYRLEAPDGLGYSQYCRRYHRWREATGKEVVMAREREPGRELFVDWMGDTLECVVDMGTGELLKAHFFVATLGDSNYPYVEAFADEKQENWLLAHVHAFEWMGGIPRVVVPDNCKTAVSRPEYYDPKLNPAYLELARHYDVAVIPARIRKPRDKSPVEGSVGWLETWLVEWLRGQRFLSFAELNREVRKRVKQLVERPFQKRVGSRKSVYEEVDRPALRPLPASRYEYAEFVVRKVPDNYHVEYDGYYYSVPYALYRQQVTLRVTAAMIEVLSDNRERVALHQRRRSGSRYISRPEHMPAKHRHQHEMNRRTGKEYREWAASIGEHTLALVEAMLRAQHVEESAYRSCMGVLQMGKKHGNDRLEAACEQAGKMGSPCYTTVKSLLQNPRPVRKKAQPLPSHENLRDPAEFA